MSGRRPRIRCVSSSYPMYMPLFPTRLYSVTALICSIMSQMVWWSTPAESQGFFQQLFGLSPAPQVRTVPAGLPPRAPIAGLPMRLERLPPPPRSSSGERVAREGSGSYTTVCVRMCDGFYFPVSQRVPRSRFHRDADVCRSRCGESESRLFTHSFGADMKSAVDLTGRAYAALPIAFLHRKRLVSGCKCKPEPWSEASLMRHEGYAIAEGLSVPGSRGMGGVAVVAGSYSAAAPLIEPPSTRDPQTDESDARRPDEFGKGVAGALSVAAQAPAGSGDANTAPPNAGQPNPGTEARTPAPNRVAGERRAKVVANASWARVPAKTATRTAVPRKAPAIRVASASTGPKLVWPGDAPTRMR